MRHSLFSAVAALALMAAPAFAGQTQTNTAPTNQNATSTATAKHGSASGLSLDNNAIDQSNLKAGGKGGKKFDPLHQDNSADTHQNATSDAYARHGDASGTSVNTNEILQQNEARVGKKSPITQENSAPTTQNATSKAVSVGGDADALSANSNAVSQGNAAGR
jgi:hypothetical protein